MENLYDLRKPEGRREYLLAYLKPLMDVSSKEAFQSLLEEVVTCAYEENRETCSCKKYSEVIQKYIEEHYMDTTLNISSIAAYFDKNPKYIARVFRQDMQEGILDYINRVRVKKAVELLSSGKESVKEVGNKVGYATYKSFCRSFIKIMGVTPGTYKLSK